MNANVIKEVEALNRIQARNNFPAVVDEDEKGSTFIPVKRLS
ncbi:hypothetical protein [Pantoea stewartii]|uniref:Uncharacterized protein n=1 Tax=Pantoea stewartii subsp. stewartii DC283 TaxID=660596 RepID=H3R9P7_PANSE|nr:hypothetical protein [Pantoea stewartii]EHU01910.1 hypothetical protein CKS_0378 [Pantoea stewartii subsp. stewartii DC283]